MSGTDVVADAASGELRRRGVPTPVVSIRVDGIRALRTNDDDGPVLLITDGDTTVEFLCGFSGRSAAAALGAERLVEAARAYSLMISSTRSLTEDGPATAGPHRE